MLEFSSLPAKSKRIGKKRDRWEPRDEAKTQLLLLSLLRLGGRASYSQLYDEAVKLGFPSPRQTFNVYIQGAVKDGRMQKGPEKRSQYSINKSHPQVHKTMGYATFQLENLSAWLQDFDEELEDFKHRFSEAPTRDLYELILEAAMRRYAQIHFALLFVALYTPIGVLNIESNLLRLCTQRLLDFVDKLTEGLENPADKYKAVKLIWGLESVGPSAGLPYFVGKMWKEHPTPKPPRPLSSERALQRQLNVIFDISMGNALIRLKETSSPKIFQFLQGHVRKHRAEIFERFVRFQANAQETQDGAALVVKAIEATLPSETMKPESSSPSLASR
jgi:hypothetical protein